MPFPNCSNVYLVLYRNVAIFICGVLYIPRDHFARIYLPVRFIGTFTEQSVARLRLNTEVNGTKEKAKRDVWTMRKGKL